MSGLIAAGWNDRGKIVVQLPRRSYRRGHLDALSAGEAEALIRILTERLTERKDSDPEPGDAQ